MTTRWPLATERDEQQPRCLPRPRVCNDARDEVDVDDRARIGKRFSVMLLERKHVIIDHLDEVAAAGVLGRVA